MAFVPFNSKQKTTTIAKQREAIAVRSGRGRKSKAEEMGLKRLLDDCWTHDQRRECITTLATMASGGDIEAIKLLMAYTFGKPKESVQMEQTGVLEVRYVSDWRENVIDITPTEKNEATWAN